MSALIATYEADSLGHRRPLAVSVKSLASEGCENAWPLANASEHAADKKSSKACVMKALESVALLPLLQF